MSLVKATLEELYELMKDPATVAPALYELKRRTGSESKWRLMSELNDVNPTTGAVVWRSKKQGGGYRIGIFYYTVSGTWRDEFGAPVRQEASEFFELPI